MTYTINCCGRLHLSTPHTYQDHCQRFILGLNSHRQYASINPSAPTCSGQLEAVAVYIRSSPRQSNSYVLSTILQSSRPGTQILTKRQQAFPHSQHLMPPPRPLAAIWPILNLPAATNKTSSHLVQQTALLPQIRRAYNSQFPIDRVYLAIRTRALRAMTMSNKIPTSQLKRRSRT